MDAFFSRIVDNATCTSSARIRELPVLVIWPRRWFSPELISDGSHHLDDDEGEDVSEASVDDTGAGSGINTGANAGRSPHRASFRVDTGRVGSAVRGSNQCSLLTLQSPACLNQH